MWDSIMGRGGGFSDQGCLQMRDLGRKGGLSLSSYSVCLPASFITNKGSEALLYPHQPGTELQGWGRGFGSVL